MYYTLIRDIKKWHSVSFFASAVVATKIIRKFSTKFQYVTFTMYPYKYFKLRNIEVVSRTINLESMVHIKSNTRKTFLQLKYFNFPKHVVPLLFLLFLYTPPSLSLTPFHLFTFTLLPPFSPSRPSLLKPFHSELTASENQRARLSVHWKIP
jgi:hypothetical protein